MRTRTMAHEHYVVGISTFLADILLYPSKPRSDILDLGGEFVRRKEAMAKKCTAETKALKFLPDCSGRLPTSSVPSPSIRKYHGREVLLSRKVEIQSLLITAIQVGNV